MRKYFALLCLMLTGCGASGSAVSGGSEMSNKREEPTTRHYKYEVFGRNPTPEEIAAFGGWSAPATEVKK